MSPSARRSSWPRRDAWPRGSSRRPGKFSRALFRRGCRPPERSSTGSPTRASSARGPPLPRSARSSIDSPPAKWLAWWTFPAKGGRDAKLSGASRRTAAFGRWRARSSARGASSWRGSRPRCPRTRVKRLSGAAVARARSSTISWRSDGRPRRPRSDSPPERAPRCFAPSKGRVSSDPSRSSVATRARSRPERVRARRSHRPRRRPPRSRR